MPVRIVNSTRIALSARPERFTLNPASPLYYGLKLALLGHAAGGGTAWDSSQHGNHGTLTNMESSDWLYDHTINRMILSCGGTDEKVVVPVPQFISWSHYTQSIWFKRPSLTAEASWGKLNASPRCSYGNYGGSSSTFYVDWPDGAWPYTTVDGTTWTSAVVQMDGDAASHSLRGKLVVNNVSYNMAHTVTSVTAQNWEIGRVADRWATALFADVMIWDHLLSAAEISAISDSNNPLLRCGSVPLILPPDRQLYPVVPSEQRSRFVTAFGL